MRIILSDACDVNVSCERDRRDVQARRQPVVERTRLRLPSPEDARGDREEPLTSPASLTGRIRFLTALLRTTSDAPLSRRGLRDSRCDGPSRGVRSGPARAPEGAAVRGVDDVRVRARGARAPPASPRRAPRGGGEASRSPDLSCGPRAGSFDFGEAMPWAARVPGGTRTDGGALVRVSSGRVLDPPPRPHPPRVASGDPRTISAGPLLHRACHPRGRNRSNTPTACRAARSRIHAGPCEARVSDPCTHAVTPVR